MADKKKIKEAIHKLKEAKERLGNAKIKNVSRPDKAKPEKKRKDKDDEGGRKRRGDPKASAVGPRGGSYKVSASGKKIYESSRVKKSMEDYYKHLEEIDNFINKHKEFKGLM